MSVFKEVGNNRKYTDVYKLIKRIQTNQETEELKTDPEPFTFKACDFIDYYEDLNQDNIISQRTNKHLTIETPSRYEFHPNDVIISVKDSTRWAIKKVTIKDDNQCKDKSLRPKKVTILELIG